MEIPVSGLEHYSNKSFVVRPVIEMCRAQQGFLNGREKKLDLATGHALCRIVPLSMWVVGVLWESWWVGGIFI